VEPEQLSLEELWLQQHPASSQLVELVLVSVRLETLCLDLLSITPQPGFAPLFLHPSVVQLVAPAALDAAHQVVVVVVLAAVVRMVLVVVLLVQESLGLAGTSLEEVHHKDQGLEDSQSPVHQGPAGNHPYQSPDCA